jgi:hypothetical protein
MAETIDLNNPPKKPYEYQEYPRLMYGFDAQGNRKHITVNSDEEKDAALEKGFSITPVEEKPAEEKIEGEDPVEGKKKGKK